MPLSAELIAALRTPPQDPERFLVIADRLQAEGDPRGVLIALQARRAVEWDSAALAAAESQHLQTHDRALLGKLWKSPSSIRLTWELGFIRHATLWTEELQPRRRTGKLTKLTRELLEIESAAMLESLTLALPRPQGWETQAFLDSLTDIARHAPPTLSVLRLRDLQRTNDDAYGNVVPPFSFPVDAAPNRRTLQWRGRPLLVETDSFLIDVVADLLGAWEPI